MINSFEAFFPSDVLPADAELLVERDEITPGGAQCDFFARDIDDRGLGVVRLRHADCPPGLGVAPGGATPARLLLDRLAHGVE